MRARENECKLIIARCEFFFGIEISKIEHFADVFGKKIHFLPEQGQEKNPFYVVFMCLMCAHIVWGATSLERGKNHARHVLRFSVCTPLTLGEDFDNSEPKKVTIRAILRNS